MDDLALTVSIVPILLVLFGLGLGALALRALRASHQRRTLGRLVTVDRRIYEVPPLRSMRYRLVGRPDEIRHLPGGARIPVELKSRAAPSRGPPLSHRIQVAAYCLLIEESMGRAPPFGVLRYGDGTEFRLLWDDRQRAELLGILQARRRPYDGRATPSVGKCRGCRFRPGCDVRAV